MIDVNLQFSSEVTARKSAQNKGHAQGIVHTTCNF